MLRSYSLPQAISCTLVHLQLNGFSSVACSAEELIHHSESLPGRWFEGNNGIQTVSVLRCEELVDGLHRIGAVVLYREADRALGNTSTGIGRHDKDDVTEICLAAVIVSQRPWSITCSNKLNLCGLSIVQQNH